MIGESSTVPFTELVRRGIRIHLLVPVLIAYGFNSALNSQYSCGERLATAALIQRLST